MDNPQERVTFNRGWLIGIIDGEGSFTISQQNRKAGYPIYYPLVQITNTNPLIIQKIRNTLAAYGFTSYLYSYVPKTGKPFWRVEIGGIKRVKRFMDEFFADFECRLEQASCVRDYVESRLSKTSHSPYDDYERQLVDRIRSLNSGKAQSSETNMPDTGATALSDDRVQSTARVVEGAP